MIIVGFALPAVVQQDIPIKLKIIAKPSNILVDKTSTITVILLNESEMPIETRVDIPIDFSTTLGHVPSSMTLYKGDDSLVTEFTSNVSGIAVISAKSKGLNGDTTSIAVVENQVIDTNPAPAPTENPDQYINPAPTQYINPAPTENPDQYINPAPTDIPAPSEQQSIDTTMVKVIIILIGILFFTITAIARRKK